MLQCALIHTHAHSHTHTHVHTHHGQSVIHASTSMLCYFNLFYFLIVDQNTNIVLSCHPIHHMFSFVFLLEPYHCLNCLVYQCAHLCMHTYTHHTQALAYTCNCVHMFIVCVNLCFLALAITNRSSCCLLHF